MFFKKKPEDLNSISGNKKYYIEKYLVNAKDGDVTFLNDEAIAFIQLKDLKNLAKDGNKRIIDIPDFVGNEIKPATNINMKYFSKKNVDDYIVRCWDIPSLMGRVIEVEDEELLDYTMCKEIASISIRFARISTTLGPFRKYRIIHYSITTEKKSQFNSPMFIELYGTASTANQVNQIEENNGDITYTKVTGPITVTIIQATWSNISHPGINVPFYW